jgi:hypothetical protein
MQIPDISQIPGTSLPLVAGDEVLVIRNGQVVKVKFAAVSDLAASNQATAAGLDMLRAEDVDAQIAKLGISQAGFDLINAADLEAQKQILGIGA